MARSVDGKELLLIRCEELTIWLLNGHLGNNGSRDVVLAEHSVLENISGIRDEACLVMSVTAIGVGWTNAVTSITVTTFDNAENIVKDATGKTEHAVGNYDVPIGEEF